jgi:hypothetical protein
VSECPSKRRPPIVTIRSWIIPLLAFENRLDCHSPFAIVVNCEDPELQMLLLSGKGVLLAALCRKTEI